MISQQSIERITKLYGLPSYVDVDDTLILSKQASVSSDATNYPVHSKSACYISNALFWDDATQSGSVDTETANELLKYAKFLNVYGDVQEHVLRKIASQEQSYIEKYAYTLNGNDYYPITTPKLTQESADAFYKDRFYLPYEMRKSAASNVLAAVNEQGVSIPDDVRDYLGKAAGLGLALTSELENAVVKRANYCRELNQRDIAAGLQKLAAFIPTAKIDRELCQKVAKACSVADEQTSLHRRYNGQMSLPEEDCHTISYKQAEEEINKYVKFANDRVYSVVEVTPFLNSFLPETTTEQFSKSAEVSDFLGTLNNNQLDTLCTILDSSGIKPVRYTFVR